MNKRIKKKLVKTFNSVHGANYDEYPYSTYTNHELIQIVSAIREFYIDKPCFADNPRRIRGMNKLEYKDWLIQNDPEDVNYYLAVGLTWKEMYGLV